MVLELSSIGIRFEKSVPTITMAKTKNENTQHHRDVPPSPLLLALEFRAAFEFCSVLPSWPALMSAPVGDGHPVIVFPGLSTSDASTLPMRGYLQNLGYKMSGWNQSYNFGMRAGVLERAKQHVLEEYEAYGERVSLVGWSLGGILAREIAKELPNHVRGVVTMGSPFAGSRRSTNAYRLYEITSERSVHTDMEEYDLPKAPPMPTTSIFSRTDGIVAWKASVQAPCNVNPHTENVEVLASHLGLPLNPSVWWAVADRLAQPIGQWQKFDRSGTVQKLLYPNPHR
jgi:pimeloyl-ACP methyl ester carboxylesterase